MKTDTYAIMTLRMARCAVGHRAVFGSQDWGSVHRENVCVYILIVGTISTD